MNSKTYSIIMLTILFQGLLALTVNIQPVKAGGTIYIYPDGHVDPPSLITRINDDTYIFTKNIFDSIEVSRDNIVIDGAGYTLQGSGSEVGIYLYDISNITIKNMNIKDFKYGIRISSESFNTTISGNDIANNGYGVWVWSENNIISGNDITNNGVGIFVSWSDNNVISKNNIYRNGYGIYLDNSLNNMIYHNNFIVNSIQSFETVYFMNFWDNGYPSGGNYWSDHNCTGNPSGGNQPYFINKNNIDFFPFQDLSGWLPPTIVVLSPQNTTYITTSVLLSFSISKQVPWIGYSLDGQLNVTITGSSVLSSLSDGFHSIILYANDIAGNLRSSIPVYFTIDTTSPTITILSPENKTYPVYDITLNFNLDESPSWIGYSLNGQTNVTISGFTTLVGLSDGSYNLVVYTNDLAGNMGHSNIVFFTVDTTPPFAVAGMNQEVDEDTTVTLDGSGSTDNVEISSYVWTFTDSTTKTLSGVTVNYTFTTLGVCAVTLNVTDRAGNWDTDTVDITIREKTLPPEIIILITVAGGSGLALGIKFIRERLTPPSTNGPQPPPNGTFVDHSITVAGTSYPIKIQSTSSVSGVSYDNVRKEIVFTAVGSDGTQGSTHVIIPKSITAGEDTIWVYVDNFLIPRTLISYDINWKIHFSYTHSTHIIQITTQEKPDENEKRVRYLNTFFTESDEKTPVPSNRPLIQDELYYLYVDISPDAIGLGDHVPFPDSVLTTEWTEQRALPLTIIARSHDFDIDSPQECTLRLPHTGKSESVLFRTRPKHLGNLGTINVDVLYQGQLLQSKRIEAYIVDQWADGNEDAVQPVQKASVTFTQTDQLTPRKLLELPPRVLTVIWERDPDDLSLDFRFLDRIQEDKEVAFFDTQLQEVSLTKPLDGIRNQLKSIVLAYGKIQGNKAMLDECLPELAWAGRQLYLALLGKKQNQDLFHALPMRTVIQVNPISGVLTIPWALLYGKQLKFIKGRTKVCDRFVECNPDSGACAVSGDPYVVCPYAFWGYRFIIEQIPCWTKGSSKPPLVRVIDNSRPLTLNMNVRNKFCHWKDHLKKLKSYGQIDILLAETIHELEKIWETHMSNIDIIYFYSHGGVDEIMASPYLEISDGRIDSPFLDASNMEWPHSPLVVLNGCATGDYGPMSYVSLIDDFRRTGASGVVGTECPISELFAEAYTRLLFQTFFQKEPLGEAMLSIRLSFLQNHKNPLGLVYSLFAANEIALNRSVV